MNTFHKLFISCFAVFSISLMHVQADQFEVILHDQQIQQFFAQRGIDLDQVWEKREHLKFDIEEKNNQEIAFPENEESFRQILQGLGFVSHFEHEDNKTCFNTILSESETKVTIEISNDFSCDDFLTAINTAINSYMNKKNPQYCENNPQHRHFYIKFIVDTDQRTITLHTAPHASQDGFVVTYSQEDMEEWLASSKNNPAPNASELSRQSESSEPKPAAKSKSSRRFGFTCKAVTAAVVVAGVAAAGYALSGLDYETVQAQIETLQECGLNYDCLIEQLGNLTLE